MIKLDAKTIQKYAKHGVPALIKMATKHFNAYIRKRDENQPCISCGRYTTLQAGHYLSAGKHPRVRFNEKNVHGQCLPCNYYNSGAPLQYRANLIRKIGEEAVLALEDMARIPNFKWNRYELIDIIETYKNK